MVITRTIAFLAWLVLSIIVLKDFNYQNHSKKELVVILIIISCIFFVMGYYADSMLLLQKRQLDWLLLH